MQKSVLYYGAKRASSAWCTAVQNSAGQRKLGGVNHCCLVHNGVGQSRAVKCSTVHYRSVQSSTVHSQILNVIILKFYSPVLLNQLGNIFLYRSSSTGSVLENILPVELEVYCSIHSQ